MKRLLSSVVLVVVLAIVIFVALAVLKFHPVEVPVPQGSPFRGPTTTPFIVGPSGPPPQ